MSQSKNHVVDAFACPRCGECDVDRLEHLNDSGTIVECSTCKLRYNPQTGAYYNAPGFIEPDIDGRRESWYQAGEIPPNPLY